MDKRTYHHADLKNELIEQGIKLVGAEGVNSFSLRKVAAACNVSHAAPYSHFKNKEELLEAMQKHITDAFSKELEDTIICHAGDPNIIEYLGQAYVTFFVDNTHYYAFLYTQSNIQIDLSSSADRATNYKPFEIYRVIIIELLNKSGYPAEKQADVAIALWAFIHGVTALATMENVRYDEDWKQKVSDFMHVFNGAFTQDDLEKRE